MVARLGVQALSFREALLGRVNRTELGGWTEV